jgi:hypothetical protein
MRVYGAQSRRLIATAIFALLVCSVWMEIGSCAFGGERGCQTICSCEYLRTARRAARSPNDPASATLGKASLRAIAQSTDVEPDRLSVLSADGFIRFFVRIPAVSLQ